MSQFPVREPSSAVHLPVEPSSIQPDLAVHSPDGLPLALASLAEPALAEPASALVTPTVHSPEQPLAAVHSPDESPSPDLPPVLSPTPKRRAWWLLLAITFLNTLGITIVLPVLPFVTLQFVPENSLALWVGLLESIYALCAFLVAPLLGALSDKYGRRPILVLSVFGAAIGYLLFGIGGALWILVLARIVQGLTAGDMPALFGYVADITPEAGRARRFGVIGAVSGVAFMAGPAIGGFLAKISLQAPLFVTAGVAVLVGLISLVALPESLQPGNRALTIDTSSLQPVGAIRQAFARPQLRGLLIGMVLLSIPFFFYANNVTVLALDTINWGPTQVGLLVSVIGVLDIVVQGALLALLVPRIGERAIILAGAIGQAVGMLGLAVVASFLPLPWLLAAATLLLGGCQGGTNAALDGVMSSAIAADEQGRLAGAVSALTSAGQVIGPLAAGWLYATTGHASPYWLGFALILVAIWVLRRALPRFGREGTVSESTVSDGTDSEVTTPLGATVESASTLC